MVQVANPLGGTWTNLMTWTAAGGWLANTAGATASESTPTGTPPDQSVVVTVTDPTVLGIPGTGGQCYRLQVSR